MGIAWSFLLMLMAAPLLIWAVYLLLIGLVSASRHRGNWPVAAASILAPVVGVLAGLIIFFPVVHATTYMMTWFVFLRHHSEYANIVYKARMGTLPANQTMWKTIGGKVYDVETGPPYRVVFRLTGWNSISGGILYDPTRLKGRPHHVDDFHWTAQSCRHMVSDYFECGFDQDGD